MFLSFLFQDFLRNISYFVYYAPQSPHLYLMEQRAERPPLTFHHLLLVAG